MIFFEYIRWKNFLNTGNALTEIQLNAVPNTLFVGDNGSGKSTILDALVFGLYGKPYRNIKKPTLVNSVNGKNCLVEVEFSLNGKAYKIRRGLKPVIFEIHCDGICLNQDSDSRDYQEYLEKNILNMSLKTFTQIVILGSASFTPFMQLSALDRRMVIENVTNTGIFSRMTAVIKGRLQHNMQELDRNNAALLAAQDKQTFIKRTLDKLKVNNEERIETLRKQIGENETAVEAIRQAIKELEATRDNLTESVGKVGNLNQKHQEAIRLQGKLEAALEKNEGEQNFYADNDRCPTCHQDIVAEFRDDQMRDLAKSAHDLKHAIDNLSSDIAGYVTKIRERNNLQRELETVKTEMTSQALRIKHLVSFINTTQTEIDRLNEADTLVDNSQKEYEEVSTEIETLLVEKKQLLSDKLYIETAANLLKDGGIKSKIIRQYLPVINKLINQYLAKMGFPINFNLNEQFEETIRSRYKESFSYENFSQGQKLRIDLALLFAWRGIAKRKNSVDCNFLIMDEILDRSLDANGTEEFIKIMQTLAEKMHIFIISPKQEHLIDKFDRTFRFSTTRHFSKIAK